MRLRYSTNKQMTAMEIRTKIRNFCDLYDVNPDDLICWAKGHWDDWIDGEESSDVLVILSRLTEITKTGTRYITLEWDDGTTTHRHEVKPELAKPDTWQFTIEFRAGG